MKKKILLLSFGLMMATLFAACGEVEEKAVEEQSFIQGQLEEPKPTEVVEVEPSVKRENTEYKMQAINLTEQNEMEISIDYAIEGYDSLQQFSYGLFEQNMDEKNPVLSPVSAYLALSLAGAGAEGETEEEFKKVLGDMEGIPYDLMTNLPREKEGMNISLANSAWIDERMNADKNWLAWADSVYKSEVFQTKLSSESAMEDMNLWIDKNTKGLIPKLLSKPMADDARLALYNTIYFKGDWRNEFSEEDTEKLDFTLEDGSIQQVEMMQLFRENLQYVESDNVEGVVLPYKDDSMAFVALKPVDTSDIREMYENLSMEDIHELLQERRTTLCNLRLPKFEVEFDKTLNDSLKNMGLELAFVDGAADFGALGKTDLGLGLYISQVRQKAKVIVDETGTEAAAVTSIEMMQCTSVMEPEMPVDIFLDEPFLYMIMDMEREVPLFIGIMDNPNE